MYLRQTSDNFLSVFLTVPKIQPGLLFLKVKRNFESTYLFSQQIIKIHIKYQKPGKDIHDYTIKTFSEGQIAINNSINRINNKIILFNLTHFG